MDSLLPLHSSHTFAYSMDEQRNIRETRQSYQTDDSCLRDNNLQCLYKHCLTYPALFSVIDLDLGRYDRSRQFKIFDNVFVGEKFSELSKELDVTLASQSSFDRLHWIIYVAKLW